MKKNENIQNEVLHAFKQKPLLVTVKSGIALKPSKYLKKLICIACLGGIILFSNACIIGKSTRETTFIPKDKKERKHHKHRVYVAGHFESTSDGQHWVRGHWERK